MDDDKRTDKLFQEGADRHDFAYDPDAWAQMESMLDQDLTRRRWIRVAALLAVILVGGLSFFYFRGDQAQNEFIPVQTEQLPTKDQVSNQEDKGIFDDQTRPAESQAGQASKVSSQAWQSSKAGNKSELDSKANSHTEQVNNSAQDADQLPELTKTTTATPAVATPAVALGPPVKSETKREATTDPLDSGNSEASSEPKQQEQTAATNRLYAISPLLQSQYFFLEIPQVPIEIDRLAKPQAQQKEAAKPKRESTGGLVVAAGFGRVHGGGGDQNFSQGENRFGLEAEYRFGKKFGAKIGGYYGNVSYCSEGKDYTAKEGFWEAGIVAQRVEASCQVVEVPLLLSYYFNGNNRDGFFLNGGVTSYFLLKEDFKFDYEDPNHDGVKTWQEINTNRHLLGFGQFSVGYQQQVGKRTAMQVEAYTQLPLTGIGHGKVNLTNIGVTAKLLFDFRK